MSSAGSTVLEMDVGFNPSLFVGNVDDGLICVICQNVVEDAAECPCGHLFCQVHIRNWLSRGKKSCPVCRTKCDSVKVGSDVHIVYRRQLSELRARCPNHTRGCTKVMPPKDIKSHFACCEFAPAYCRWDACPYNFKGEAKANSPLQQKDIAEHERTCDFRMVACELYGCSEIVPFQKLGEHMTACSQTLVMCTIRGCESRMTRRTLQTHLEDKTEMPHHMMLLSAEVARLSVLLDRPEVILNNELVFRVTDINRRFSASSFRFETKLYTLGVIGRSGYNFRVQLRKREWPDDRKRFNDKLGIYLHIEQGDMDDILEWPFPYLYTFSVLDQTRTDPLNIDFTVTDGATRGADWLGPGSGKGWGPQGIASFDMLRSRNYIKNDSLFVKVTFSRP